MTNPSTQDPTYKRLYDKISNVISVAEQRRKDINDLPEFQKDIRKYALVSLPRTGSTMLAESLASANMGVPMEWFNARYCKIWRDIYETDTLNWDQFYSDMLLGTVHKGTNVFGVNFHIDQYLSWKKKGLNLFELGFERVYYISRRNIMRQSYSLAKAKKTGLWSKTTERMAGYEDSPKIEMSVIELLQSLSKLLGEQGIYDNEVKPRVERHFYYEDLLQDDGLEKAVLSVCDDFDCLPENKNFLPQTEKQTNQEDEMVLDQVLKQLGVQIRDDLQD